MPPDGTPPQGAGESQPLCSHCNDVLGVYEPIILLVDGQPPQFTSRAAAPVRPDGIAFHQDCFMQSRGGADADRSHG